MTSNRFLEHPDISIALRTGYPHPNRSHEDDGAADIIEVSDEEFAAIVSRRFSKTQDQSDKADRKA